MKERSNHIFTIYDEVLSKADKEAMLGQKGMAIWMTGLSGSGKTTVAKILERKLWKAGIVNQLLDGDNIRHGLNNNLTFSEEDRKENIRRIAEVNKLLIHSGLVAINCFVSPTQAIRQLARDIIGSSDFIEVYVDTPLEVCESRDVKGLYKKARAGIIPDFTGISAPFEAPTAPEVHLRTPNKSADETANELFEYIMHLTTTDSNRESL